MQSETPPRIVMRNAMPLHPAAQRENVPLGELADCLLLAYEHIADLAQESVEIGELFDRTSRTLTLEERINARRHLLPDMEFDVTETAESFYLLASVPGFSSGHIDIGLDPKWVAIFAHREPREANLRKFDHDADANYILESHRQNRRRLDQAEGPAKKVAAPALSQIPVKTNALPDRLFGAREFASPIDPERATAVVSNGLLALKLPKA